MRYIPVLQLFSTLLMFIFLTSLFWMAFWQALWTAAALASALLLPGYVWLHVLVRKQHLGFIEAGVLSITLSIVLMASTSYGLSVLGIALSWVSMLLLLCGTVIAGLAATVISMKSDVPEVH